MPDRVEIHIYRGRLPQAPFFKWLQAQKDRRTVAIIQARLNRLRLGNFGDSKSVGAGVEELRIDYGPGYRVYFGRSGGKVIVLLCAGNKSTQGKDIEKAQEFWRDYLNDED